MNAPFTPQRSVMDAVRVLTKQPANDQVPDLLSAEYRPWLESEEEKLRSRWNAGNPA